MAELVVGRKGEPRLRMPIDRDCFWLGTARGNNLALEDDDLYPHEAVIERRDESWWIKDASGRGTRLDHTVVHHEAPLFDGSVIHLGLNFTAAFRLSDHSASEESHQGSGQTRAKGMTGTLEEIRLDWETPLDEESVTLTPGDVAGIGKEDSNRIVIQDEYVSSFHARIYHHKGAWRLEDLDSTNGTYLDEIRVREAVLEPGMRIRAGDTVFRILKVQRRTGDFSIDSHGIVTGDPALKAVLDQIPRLAESDATVTVFGESGTGKELVARALHDVSSRYEEPFIPVNCAAISKELIESELFGHEKGAFTGAAAVRRGAFEEANGGTLFLDEVGELPLDLQAKLLRAIELKEIRRVGSSRPITVSTRIVAATNRNLHLEVREGRFREDLFYRLYVVPLTLPPLRRRKDDALLLAEHFLSERTTGQKPALTDAAKRKLREHDWPGNVRELKNTIERAILFHESGRIDDSDIVFPSGDADTSDEGILLAGVKTLAQVERETIENALRATGGNRRSTAKALGIARSTLQTKLKELGLLAGDGEDD